MKHFLTIIFMIAAFIIINPFDVSATAEEEWKKDLNLSDTISSSIVEVDKGVVLIQYEGGASENSTLTKYDLKGNQIWSIKNDYGYEMGALDGGVLVYTTGSNYTMTKISSEGKVVWTKQYKDNAHLSSRTQVIDLEVGFIISDSNSIYRYDNNGNLLRSIKRDEILEDIFGDDNYSDYNFNVSLSNDKESILVFLTRYQRVTGGTSGYYHTVAEYSLNLDYKSSTIAYSGSDLLTYLTKMIETENNYIITGNYTLVFNKKGQIDKILNVAMMDIEYIDGYIYAYVGKTLEDYGSFNTYIAKYDENMKKIAEYQLPYTFSSDGSTYSYGNFINTTSFADLKNRSVFYKDANDIHFIALNSAIVEPGLTSFYADVVGSNYNIAQYRFADGGSNSAVTDDGIIDNIFENPETSSIAVVIAFVVVILLGGIGFYFGYKKKKAKNM